MATSVFRGFKIKGIDEERLPSEEERAPRPVRGGYRGRNMEVVEYPPYPVFILLESIRGSDDAPLPEIDSEIRRIWKKFFDEGRQSLERYHQEYLHEWDPDKAIDEIRRIGLTYYDDGDCGQIRIVNTHLEEVEDLIIREFTKGWAVYNRSGNVQTITLPIEGTPVSARSSSGASLTHQLPDLDGEIYLKVKNPADVNQDGLVNVLDLLAVANGFGTSVPDLNGDGVVDVRDLALVAGMF